MRHLEDKCDCRKYACELQKTVDDAYAMLLCGEDVGGYPLEERVRRTLEILSKWQLSIG